MTNEKEPGQMFAELWFSANCWSSLDHEEREQCAKLESAIRADEKAKTVDQCARVADAYGCGLAVCEAILALTEKKDG